MTGPPILRALFRLDPDPDSIQPSNYLLRIGKKIANDFDLIVSANNEADFGRPSIQYVHYPYLASSYARFPHSCGETIGGGSATCSAARSGPGCSSPTSRSTG